MAYCANCGMKLVQNAKFCQKCGYPTGAQIDGSVRKQEFAGKIYKCPYCGEVLKSFELNCPACGYELRSVKATSAVKEFATKLEAIESRREYEKPRTLFAGDASQQRISKTDEQKISLIRSFVIPNSKEDLLEFMILATSNINMKIYDFFSSENAPKSEKEINDAWFAKVQQVYEKAKRSYSTDDVFSEIKTLYDRCNEGIKKSRKKAIVKIALCFGWIPLGIIILILYLIISSSVEEPREIKRLENIVAEVQTALASKEYKQALRIADSIDYQRYDVETERQWDIQREYWVDKVIDAAATDGVVLEYTPTPDVDKANDHHDRGMVEAFEEAYNEAYEESFLDGYFDGSQPDLESVKKLIELQRILDGEAKTNNKE